MESKLFKPLTLRETVIPNRIMVSPMCTYSAVDGVANDFHLAHLGQFALGGAGLIFVEATAVTADGRITHGDVGLWNDVQIEPLAKITRFVKGRGSVPAIQLAHAGRKASMQRPWEGDGPLSPSEAARGELPWTVVSASNEAFADGWLHPHALTREEMEELKRAYVAAAERALCAGFEIIEMHAAHGYLLNSFLSPLSNQRSDEYGVTREGRFRFPLEVAAALREFWPAHKPVFVRVSAIDRVQGGVTINDTVAFAVELKRLGIDLVDCSSGGIAPGASKPEGYGYQVGFAEEVRRGADIDVSAVGLIVDPHQAEEVVQNDRASLVAIGRAALEDPYWPLHARRTLDQASSNEFEGWPQQYRTWLRNRAKAVSRFEESFEGREGV